MLTITLAASDSRAPVNEDVAGHCGDAAWVIDGATGIGPALRAGPSDAAWLAGALDAAFRALLAADPALPTGELVRAACAAARDGLAAGAVRAAAGPHEHPSAAFVMLRRWADHVELVGLADCRIAYRDDAGVPRLFGDTALAAIEARTLALVRELLASAPDLAPDALFARVRPQLLANRGQMNRPGGYWVLGTEPAAADHLARMTLPLRAGQRFALASDGILRLIDLFGIAGPGDLLAIDGMAAWEAWLALLRTTEAAPGSRAAYPRVKPHDDATLLTLHI